jgi:hypothetical protein
MRECAKIRCHEPVAAGVRVRYADRVILVQELRPQPDHAVLELCVAHVARLVPPLGWHVQDAGARPAPVAG